ncbi:unnamed protein product [Effrenium voratum]|uniref:Glutamate--cysteine ligase n=1 Tax=Effrenium voratum TaxID=2562239 RepID=A0AA36HSX0_9DINO|nr:unnamed protein product [Effrenium voratum]CAJ1417953.1 unnamed protein product [Effrenium voratum]
MGLLTVGTPLAWEDMLHHSRYIRKHGVLQFLHTLRRMQHLENDPFLYGDEVEYGLLKVDPIRKTVRLSLRGPEAMEALRRQEQEELQGCAWHEEYGSWMLEGTPRVPYGGYVMGLLGIEQNMRLRRGRILSVLNEDEMAPTLVAFPLLGVGFTGSSIGASPASDSALVPDSCINPHPRFATLTANIRKRRGSKVDIRVPLFKDSKTTEFETATEPMIHMDCMAFGMGCCCLQVTFQASDLDESRLLYDQLAVLAPIMLALTAATPIVKGRLAATDARWSLISQSVDDRTPAERGEAGIADARMAGAGIRKQSKSRYDSISCFIHPGSRAFNDLPCETDEDTFALLQQEGVDEALAQHVSHLFTRDPLAAFAGHVEEVDDFASTDHFESIQSTNWQTVRWKPPPATSACGTGAPHVGWRTEFRSMEVQLTDFENAAFTAFMVLVSRAILVFNLNLLVPLSKVDENMGRAHAADAVGTQNFWFRRQIWQEAEQGELCEMTMDEIMNGSKEFVGLVPLCYAYLKHIRCDNSSFKHLDQYLKLISGRASGELMTPAKWMRCFVRSHKEYKFDSVVSESIAFDMVKACNDIGLGKRPCPEILGEVEIEPITTGQYETPLFCDKLGPSERKGLLQKMLLRAPSALKSTLAERCGEPQSFCYARLAACT